MYMEIAYLTTILLERLDNNLYHVSSFPCIAELLHCTPYINIKDIY